MELSLSVNIPDESTFRLGKDMKGVTITAYFNRLGQSSNFEASDEIVRFTRPDAQLLRGPAGGAVAGRYLCFQAKSTFRLDGNDREDLLSQGSIPVSALMDLTQARAPSSIPVQLHDHSMMSEDRQSTPRGTFLLTVQPGAKLPATVDVSQSAPETAFHSRVEELFAAFERAPEDYGVEPVLPQAANMRVPFFRTNLMTVPGAFYVWRKPHVVRQPDVIPLYVAQYGTLLEASLAFHGNLSTDAFHTVLDAFVAGKNPPWHDVHMACRVTANVFSLQATAMNYESDRTVGDRMSERFKISRNGDRAGDCEDLGKDIHLSAELFMDIGEAGHLRGVLLLVYRLCCCYVWTMLSGMVSSPSIDQKSAGPQFGNHIFAGAIPRTSFLHMAKASFSQTAMANLKEALYRHQPFLPDEERLEQMVLEGTGWSNPLPNAWSAYVDDDARDLREIAITKQQAVQSIEATTRRLHPELAKAFKSELHQRVVATPARNPMQGFPSLDKFSSFYKYIISCWVDLRRFGITSHCDFLVVNQRTRKYGVDYRQWVAKNSEVQLLAQFHLDDEQEQAVRWALSCQEPFVRPSTQPIKLRHNRVQGTAKDYQPFSHEQAALFAPVLFYNLRSRRQDVLDAEDMKNAVRDVLNDSRVLVQHAESTEVIFPGEEQNRLYTLDMRLYV